MDAKEFVRSGKHLPPVLREWSFQGWLFRWIDLAVAKRKAEDDHLSVKLPDCIAAHIYVIDYFLWFMGQFGYTLQRSRAKVEFYDLQACIAEFERQQRELSWQRLAADLGKGDRHE